MDHRRSAVVVAIAQGRRGRGGARQHGVSGHRPQPVRCGTPRPSDAAHRFPRTARRIRGDGRESRG